MSCNMQTSSYMHGIWVVTQRSDKAQVISNRIPCKRVQGLYDPSTIILHWVISCIKSENCDEYSPQKYIFIFVHIYEL